MSGITRKQFLTAAAAGAALAPALQIRAAGEVGANDRIRLGAVGYGMRGRGDLAEFLRNAEVECAVVCDVDVAHAEAAAKHVAEQGGNRPDVEIDFRRVMERNDLDAVLVATPDHWHALPTIYACQTGKDVYVEKPLARTIGEGRAILTAARENKRVVQMGTQWRSGDHYADAVDFVRSGQLGKIRFIRGWSYKTWDIQAEENTPPPEGVDYDLWLGPAPEWPFNPNRFHRNFRWYWDYAGGLMTDLGVHVLNFVNWAVDLPAPLRVSSVGGLPVMGGIVETPDTQTAIYQFPEYNLTWEHQLQGRLGPHAGQSGTWIHGEYGAVQLHQGGWGVVPDPGIDSPLEAADFAATEDGRPAHVKNFLACMHSREQPVSNPEVGHRVTTLAHLGNLAYRAGGEVHWDGAAERITNNDEADALVSEPYREPWTLPYKPRA